MAITLNWLFLFVRAKTLIKDKDQNAELASKRKIFEIFVEQSEKLGKTCFPVKYPPD